MGLFSSEPTPLEKAVARATDERLTREDWSQIIEVCNLVNEQAERNGPLAVQAVCQRLASGNGNVQLYGLTLLNVLAQNCGPATQREIAAANTAACLTRLGTAHGTHVRVLTRLVDVLGQLKEQFAQDPTLRQIDVVYTRVTTYPHTRELLRQAGALPAASSDTKSSSGAGAGAGAGATSAAGATKAAAKSSSSASSGAQKTAEEQEEEDLRRALELSMQDMGRPQAEIENAANAGHNAAPTRSHARVRALYDFAASEDGELSFETGDIIEVLDVVYKEWWRGRLRNEIGIFPVNYVEQIEEAAEPDASSTSVRSVPHSSRSLASSSAPTATPTATATGPGPAASDASSVHARGASAGSAGQLDEAYIFAQAATVDKLLTILATANQEGSSSVIENEDVQSLYHQVASMRPRVIQLIDEYALRKQELVDLNNKLLQARRSYDRLMEDAVSGYQRQAPANTGAAGAGAGAAAASPGWPYGQAAQAPPPAHAYTTQALHQQTPQASIPHTPAPQYAPPPAAAGAGAPPQQYAPTYSMSQYAQPPPAASYFLSPADSRQSVASPLSAAPTPYNPRLPYPDAQGQPPAAPASQRASSGSLPYANGVPTSPR